MAIILKVTNIASDMKTLSITLDDGGAKAFGDLPSYTLIVKDLSGNNVSAQWATDKLALVLNNAASSTDALVIQASKDSVISNRVFVDFAENYASENAIYNLNFSEAGTYALKVDTVNSTEMTNSTAGNITIASLPTAATVEIIKGKPHLVQLPGNFDVKVTLTGATNGGYEVVLSESKS